MARASSGRLRKAGTYKVSATAPQPIRAMLGADMGAEFSTPARLTVQALTGLFGAVRGAGACANLLHLRSMTLNTFARTSLCALALCLALSPLGVGATQLGVYRWEAPLAPANVDAFEVWLGSPVALAEAFEAR